MTSVKTPVLFIVFNRLSTAQRVFEAIRDYQPERLYIAADGPRADHSEDNEKCAAVRALAKQVDWPCTTATLFHDKNLDCKKAITTAVNWFFSFEPEGIVLEDDCLPGKDFFPYCTTLLERYRYDERVMHIGGANLQQGRRRGHGSYYFSSIPSIWGWAAWRRSWTKYDINMTLFPEFEHYRQMINILPDERIAAWATAMARQVYEGKINTYDYQWAFTLIVNHGLGITPNVNLVSNIGFSADARHTTNSDDVHANIPVRELKEIVHPEFMLADREADLFQISLSVPANPAPAPANFFHHTVQSVKKMLHAARF
jgi:hypothetical protein